MKLKVPSINNLFPLNDSYIRVEFEIDNKTYDVDQFQIQFQQELDHKGQPQQEVQGGQFSLTLTEAVGYNILNWAKRDRLRKNGKILFKQPSSGTILKIEFQNADCISLRRRINHQTGTTTTLVIAPETLSLNGTTHNNQWGE